jgi:hypothetical protein
MNALNRTIEKGEIVVVKRSWMKDEFKSLDKRLFKCNGSGFGTIAGTAGTAIFGEWLHDNSSDRIEGTEISREETLEYQSKQ